MKYKMNINGRDAMALKQKEFEVLYELSRDASRPSQRQIAEKTGLSLGTVNKTLSELSEKQLIEDGSISSRGLAALEPYRVDNAVIMAAGLSSRFAPISYEKPKGLLKVRGEVLIERQIRQLKEAGIDDITVVVGYKKEYFFYLKEKFGVRIVVNPEYATRNNNGTLWRVRNILGNTYICSSDDYFTENVFRDHVYKAEYSAIYAAGETDEWCIETAASGRIAGVTVGGRDSWIMLGHVYFDREFSKKFVSILEAEYIKPETAGKLWESIYLDHVKELDMRIRKYPAGVINEFDSIDELRDFDPAFMENVDSDILDNIVSVLHCSKNEICDFYPLKQGLTNLSCHFRTNDGEYVYRHPGVGTEKLVDRRSEEAGLRLAKKLGLDETFIHEDPDAGWKISRFIPNAKNLDPMDDEQLKTAMEMCRKLHESGAHLDRKFDFFDEGKHYEAQLKMHGPIDVPGYDELARKAERLHGFLESDGYPKCVNHNDFFSLNFLIDDKGHYSLIDWEYAGMSDVANDFGTFCVCCQFDPKRIDLALSYYLGHKPTLEERRHFWGQMVLAGWCWYVWSLVKEADGENVGEWFYIYYSYAADYMDEVLSWYGEKDENGSKE